MATIELRYLQRDTSRHGQLRLYVRRKGRPRIRLLVEGESDPNFMLAYVAALRGERWKPPVEKDEKTLTKSSPGTLRAVCEAYYQSAEFRLLAERTRYVRRAQLEAICQARVRPDAAAALADCPIARFDSSHVRMILDRKAATPEAANNSVKSLSSMFRWAVEARLATINPTTGVKRIRTGSEGFTAWTLDDIRAFEKRHPIGTKARLALALLLFTGQRRSDVVTFGRQHVREGKLTFVQAKNKGRAPKRMTLTVIPALRSIIDASPTGDLTFLVTGRGKAFTVAGFGNWFRDRCNDAGLPDLSAHGLRKALQAIGANSGLTDRELMAIAGHENERETSRYTKSRDRDGLAASGLSKLAAGPFANKSVPPEKGSQKGAGETGD